MEMTGRCVSELFIPKRCDSSHVRPRRRKCETAVLNEKQKNMFHCFTSLLIDF
jgi:hypothetical protein